MVQAINEIQTSGGVTSVSNSISTDNKLTTTVDGVSSTPVPLPIPDISGKADKSEIPTKVGELTNDKGYTTKAETTVSASVSGQDLTINVNGKSDTVALPSGGGVTSVSNSISTDNKLTTTVNGVSSVPVQLPSGGGSGGHGIELTFYYVLIDHTHATDVFITTPTGTVFKRNCRVFDMQGNRLNDSEYEIYPNQNLMQENEIYPIYVKTTDGRVSNVVIFRTGSGGSN